MRSDLSQQRPRLQSDRRDAPESSPPGPISTPSFSVRGPGLRIAWFTHRYYPCLGGSENFSRAMVRRLVARGHHVDVITSDAFDLWYFNDPRRKRVDAPAEDALDGARILRFAVKHFPFQRYLGRLLSHVPHWPTRCRWASYMPVLPGIEKVRGDYDAVFALGFPYTIFSYSALLTARAAGAPLLLSPFLHLSTPGDLVNRSYTRPHQIRLLGEADTVFVQTDLEGKTVAGWGIPKERIVKLGMGVEPKDVTGGDRVRFRDRLKIPRDRRVVGQLGANDPNKGTCDLIRAVGRLNATRSADDPIHLVLAGSTSPDFEAFVAQLPQENSRWLSILGLLPDEDRADFYASLDLFAMPSRTDSFGIVFLEAWANGLPVVAAAAGGVAEIVEHGRTGALVTFGEIDQLASAIGRLLDDQELARRLGDAGREMVGQEGYTWDSRFHVLMEQVHSLIGERIPGRSIIPHGSTYPISTWP